MLENPKCNILPHASAKLNPVEYLLTSHAGAWSYSNASGVHTKKEHGLFVCRVAELGNHPYVLCSALSEALEWEGKSIALGTHPRRWNHAEPAPTYIAEQEVTSQSILTKYQLGNTLLQKEMRFVEGENRLLITYTLLRGKPALTLLLEPLLAFRNINELTFSNAYCNTLHGEPENGVSYKMYADFPAVHFQCSHKIHYSHRPQWYKGFTYSHSNAEAVEDLYAPGVIRSKLRPTSPVVLQISLHPTDARSLHKVFLSQKQTWTKPTKAQAMLTDSARRFIAAKGKQHYLLAELPFREATATEVLKALPGLKLALKNCHTCIHAEHHLIAELKKQIENKGKPKLTQGFSDPELLFWACWSFISIHKKDEPSYNYYMDLVVQLVQVIRQNKVLGVKLNTHGLVKLRGQRKQETANTPQPSWRTGYLADINAIWYNAIAAAAAYVENASLKASLASLESTLKKAFVHKFWDASRLCLYDFVDKKQWGTEIRPGMLYAVALPYSPLSRLQQKQVLQTLSTHLKTPHGIRSLSPESIFYAGRLSTGTTENGSADLAMLPLYCEAQIRVNGRQGYKEVNKIKQALQALVVEYPGGLPRYYTGNPPYSPLQGKAEVRAIAETARLFHLEKRCQRYLHKNPNAATFDFPPYQKANPS